MARKLRTHVTNCEQCGIEFTRVNRYMKPGRFCSIACSNKWSFEHGRISSFSTEFAIRKLGEDVVKEQKAALFHTFNCEFCGKSVTKRRRNPLLRFCNSTCSNKWNSLHRKQRIFTTEERQALSERATTRMKMKPETLYSWSTIKGWYKGFFFRSSYEYFFMKKLEAEGFSLKEDVVIDPFSIKYVVDGQEHNYRPDFYVPKLQTVFEIKNSYANDNDPKVAAKAKAATVELEKQGITYKILTESDLNIPSNVRNVVEQDQCVALLPMNTESDALDEMFDQQNAFMHLLQKNRTFPEYPLDLSKKENQVFVKNISQDCMHELFEAVHLLKNSKLHRATDVSEFDREHFVEELADALHYMIEIFLLLGVSSKDVFYSFMKKGTINSTRILEGY